MTLAIKAIPTLSGYKNLVTKVVMCLSALVLMTFFSCKDNGDEPVIQPEPTDMVRLVSFKLETIKEPLPLTTQLNNVWQNGRLMRQSQTVSPMGVNALLVEIFTYNERSLCTEMYSDDGRFHHYYTYTPDGRIAKEVHLSREDTLAVTEVLAYDADGNIAETKYRVPSTSLVLKNHLTWQNGDLVKAVVENVTEGKETNTMTFTYDNYPSAFIGYPVALGLSDIRYMAMHCSKHNQIDSGFTPSYENGRIVSYVKDDGTEKVHFTYDDGTGQQ